MKNQSLKAALLKTYLSQPNADGKKRIPMFLYTLTGSPEALAMYKEAKTKEGYYAEEDGKPLWHTSRSIGQGGTVIMLEDGRLLPDNSDIAIANSFIAQIPDGPLQKAVADIYAQKLVNRISGKQTEEAVQDTVNVEHTDLDDVK